MAWECAVERTVCAPSVCHHLMTIIIMIFLLPFLRSCYLKKKIMILVDALTAGFFFLARMMTARKAALRSTSPTTDPGARRDTGRDGARPSASAFLLPKKARRS
jgi:hypothetical protein